MPEGGPRGEAGEADGTIGELDPDVSLRRTCSGIAAGGFHSVV